MIEVSDESLTRQFLKKPKKQRQTSLCNQIIKFLCCIFEGEEEYQSDTGSLRKKRSSNSMVDSSQRREKNDLKLFGNLTDGNNCLVRNTHKNFFVDVMQRKPQKSKESDARVNFGWIYFSLFDHGVKFSHDEYTQLLPEKLNRYISKRISMVAPEFVVEVFTKSSGPFLFTENVPLTMLVSDDQQILLNARHNTRQYCSKGNFELIKGTINSITSLSPDVLFINPYIEKNDEPFSIYTHIYPDIRQIIHKSLLITTNIILVMPAQAQPIEVTTLFSYFFRKLSLFQEKPSFVNKIEIQRIQIDGEINYHIFYVGSVANTAKQDEVEFVARMLNEDRQSKELQQLTLILIDRLCERHVFRNILDLAIQAQQQSKNKIETVLQAFINKIIAERYISKIEVDELFGRHQADDVIYADTPRYKEQTPATFDPKDMDSSRYLEKARMGHQIFIDETPKRPLRKTSANISISKIHEHVSFRNNVIDGSMFVGYPKQLNSQEYGNGSINYMNSIIGGDQHNESNSFIFRKTNQ